MIAAQQYYVEFGPDFRPEHLSTMIGNYIPDYFIHANDKSIEKWLTLVLNAYRKSYFYREPNADSGRIKEDITRYAKFKWPLLFSRFYEALRIDGPLLQKNDIIIAINWTGIYMVDDQEQV